MTGLGAQTNNISKNRVGPVLYIPLPSSLLLSQGAYSRVTQRETNAFSNPQSREVVLPSYGLLGFALRAYIFLIYLLMTKLRRPLVGLQGEYTSLHAISQPLPYKDDWEWTLVPLEQC